MASFGISQVYTQIGGWKDMEQQLKSFLEKTGEKDLDAVFEKMKRNEEENKRLNNLSQDIIVLEEKNKNLEKEKEKLEEKNKNLEKEKKQFEKTISNLEDRVNDLTVDMEYLEEQVENWESEYGDRDYEETAEDKKFYNSLYGYPENTCEQLKEKLKVVANRIADKLGVGAYVQEDDGMIFTSFGRCGEITDRGSKDMVLSPRERKMITKDLGIYGDLDYKWKRMWWDKY